MAVDLYELQKMIIASSHDYTSHYGIERTPDWTALKFAEEAGEVMQAYVKFSGRSRHAIDRETARKNLASEIADAIGMALILAADHDLDLHAAFEREWHITLPPKGAVST